MVTNETSEDLAYLIGFDIIFYEDDNNNLFMASFYKINEIYSTWLVANPKKKNLTRNLQKTN